MAYCVSACNFDGVDGPCPYRGADCRHVACSGFHVWTAPDAQAGILTSLCRKQSCLRPVCAAEPLAQMKSADQVPIKITRSIWRLDPLGCPDPRFDRFVIFPQPRRIQFRLSRGITRSERRRPRSFARSPRRCERSCWPGRPQQPSAACAPSGPPAMLCRDLPVEQSA